MPAFPITRRRAASANSIRLRTTFVSFAVLWRLFGGGAAGDVVLYAPQDGGATRRISGEVLDYTGKQLTIRRSAGRQETLAAERVLEVRTAWSEVCQQADQRFSAGDFSAAISGYQAAFKAEKRDWAKRRIAAQLVWCLRYRAQIRRAADAFLWLYRSDPTTQYWDCIPVSWTGGQQIGEFNATATKWLSVDQSPAAQLIAASWLLPTEQRQAALEVLGRIDSTDRRIGALAEAQLWRTRIGAVTPQEVEAWQHQLESMPFAIRAGPYYTLAQALSHNQQPTQAALAYLRIPIHFVEQRELSAAALLAAGRELEKIDQATAAIPLYREAVADYAELATSAAAQRHLDRLLQPVAGD